MPHALFRHRFVRISTQAHGRYVPVLFAYKTFFFRLTVHRPVQQQQQHIVAGGSGGVIVIKDESRDCNASFSLDDDDSTYKMMDASVKPGFHVKIKLF